MHPALALYRSTLIFMLSSVFVLLVAAVIVGAFFYLAFQAKPTRNQRASNRYPSQRSRVSGRVKRELYALLNGDQAAAQRLVQQAQLRYSDRSEQWCWEKVIFDLKRDRRA
ncbi:MAG: hypothetical protein ACAF41_18010 [Leptolyngbya sp. BL-A-14]